MGIDASYKGFMDLSNQEKEDVHQIQKRLEYLRDMIRRSITLCELCQSGDKDMAYFPQKTTWYCTDFYPRIRKLYEKYL